MNVAWSQRVSAPRGAPFNWTSCIFSVSLLPLFLCFDGHFQIHPIRVEFCVQYRYHVNAIHPGSVLHSHTQRAGRASLRKRGGKGKSRKMGELRATGATSVDASAIALAGTVANAGSGGDGESAAGASSTGGPGERERGGETDTLGARAGPTRLLSNYRLRSFRHIRRVGFRESVPHGTGRRPVFGRRGDDWPRMQTGAGGCAGAWISPTGARRIGCGSRDWQ